MAGIKWRGLGGKEEEEEEERPLLKSGVVVRGRGKKKKRKTTPTQDLPPVRPSARPTLCVLTFFFVLWLLLLWSPPARVSFPQSPLPSPRRTWEKADWVGGREGSFYAVDRKTRF